MKTKIIDGVEYECETHDFNKLLSKIKIPKGWRLWTAEECIKLHNSKFRKGLNLDDCWFFIKQPFKNNRLSVAGFSAYSDRTYMDFNVIPSVTYYSLGVRFARDIKRGGK